MIAAESAKMIPAVNSNGTLQIVPSRITRAESDDDDQCEVQRTSIENDLQRSKKSKTRISLTQQIFGIGPNKRGVEGSRIIHPNSPFAQGVSLLTTLLLAYVAIVTPVTIGFFWTADGCFELPTLKMDMAVDAFFLAEIVYNFFVGITFQGRYRDDLGFVAKSYLKGSFMFDLITSIPVAIIEYITLHGCVPGDDAAVGASQLRVVRASKPLRIFKMVRVLKTSRLVYVFDWLESEAKPPQFLASMLRILCTIAMIVHVCTCAFWLVKDGYEEDGEVAVFLEDNGLSTHPDLANKYVLGMYFINTVFTTVGFGDIHATNGAERVYYVLVMYIGTLVFGTLLGEVQLIMAQLSAKKRERSEVVKQAKDYLREVEAPAWLERRLLRWLNFEFAARRRETEQAEMFRKCPPMLQRELAAHVHRDTLTKLPVFNEMQHVDKDAFLLALFLKMHTQTTCKWHSLAKADAPADRLLLLKHGSVKVTLGVGDINAPGIATLIPGDSVGVMSLFEDGTWKTAQGKPASFWCESSVECLCLMRTDFLDVLSKFPAELEDEVFFLAEQELQVRAKTAEIEDLQVLRWCQLNHKLLNRHKAFDQEERRARSRRTTFKLALYKQRHRAEDKGGRRSSALLASTTNLNPNASATSLGPGLATSPLAQGSPARPLPSTESFCSEVSPPQTLNGGERAKEGGPLRLQPRFLGESDDLGAVAALLRAVQAEARSHHQALGERMEAMEGRVRTRMAALEESMEARLSAVEGALAEMAALQPPSHGPIAEGRGKGGRSRASRSPAGARRPGALAVAGAPPGVLTDAHREELHRRYSVGGGRRGLAVQAENRDAVPPAHVQTWTVEAGGQDPQATGTGTAASGPGRAPGRAGSPASLELSADGGAARVEVAQLEFMLFPGPRPA